MARRRILIVEDDVVFKMSLEAVLAELGPVAIVNCRTLGEARHSLRERFDFAFIGLQVAGEDSSGLGYALAAKGVPFAFLSGRPDSDLRQIGRGPLISNPPRRTAVRQAMARIDDDLLVA